MAASFPKADGSVSPNMHLSFHLRDQLLDFGPPAGWWCQPYERFNGLLGRVPVNRAKPAESTMTRGLKILAVAHLVASAGLNSSAEEGTERYFSEAPQDAGDCVRSLNGKKLQYQWTSALDDEGRTQYQLHESRRNGLNINVVFGHEPFAGEVRCATFRKVNFFSTNIPRVPLTGAPCEQYLRLSKQSSVQLSLVSVQHVLACLKVHYLETRKEELRSQLEADRVDSLEDTGDDGRERIREQVLGDPIVVQWLEVGLGNEIIVYDTLVMGGEVYGSAGGRNPRSSYVGVWFPNHGTHVPVLWYGQVSYYFSHKWRNSQGDDIVHFFAVCRWFTWEDGTKAQAKQRYFGHINSISSSKQCMDSFDSFPILTTKYHAEHTLDAVPVQRIAFRWIPTRLSKKEGDKKEGKKEANKQLAASIPTRLHG